MQLNDHPGVIKMPSYVGVNTYRRLIGLDEPFSAPLETASDDATRQKTVGELLEFLYSENPALITRGEKMPCNAMRRKLKEALTLRPPVTKLPEWFHTKMDQILQAEAVDRGWIDTTQAARRKGWQFHTDERIATQIALWQGDITRLKIDTITNAANAELLGCFRPFHNCIDNVIHNAAGPRVREDCHTIMQHQGKPEPSGQAKITKGYNLPAKYIIQTVGPIVTDGKITQEAAGLLASCYRSCLNLASQVSDIRSVAFCCISTGVFGFPNEAAAQIAITSVKQWIGENPKALDLIIFNVFQDRDLKIYERLLTEDE